MKIWPAELWREGKLVRTTEAPPCAFYVVPVPDPPVCISGAFPPVLPVHVLVDRYNSAYDEYFPEVERKNDWYRCVRMADGILRFEYSHTETRLVRSRG